MRTDLTWKKRIIRCILAAVLLLAGWGFTLVGEQLFGALGLPVWSEGDRGWNYVGLSAFVILLRASLCSTPPCRKRCGTGSGRRW